LFRIVAILRRIRTDGPAGSHIFTLGNIIFDSQKQTLRTGEITHKLTTKESDLLKLLCVNANQVLERNFALRAVWEDDNYFNARSMDVYITKLRKLFKNEPAVEIINVHGRGFRLVV